MMTGADIVIDAPYAKVHVTGEEVGDHALMRARQLAELLLLVQPPEGAGTVLWLAQQLADEVVASIVGLMGGKS